ncbi:hypothetical protein [Telluria aromaticivorans]|uniref:Uncharacterized protein n=1 Tax=Telluria aromaticivorans TaxID=2725995 RepID=A0A7Y2P1X9_9BURK|nr:hypothetical protein [Telluria aromaticivorans]NNG24344.1 hypothetical protein [Telluria aromaticivorans]
MSKVLSEEDSDEFAVPGAFGKAGGWWSGAKAWFARRLRVADPAPWQAGYDAFYRGVDANPHALGAKAFSEWEQGRKAFREDFDW